MQFLNAGRWQADITDGLACGLARFRNAGVGRYHRDSLAFLLVSKGNPRLKRFRNFEGSERMGRLPGRWTMVFGLGLLMTVLSCARSVPEVRHVVVDARHSLLIASDTSEFKDYGASVDVLHPVVDITFT